jgi:dihydroorotase
MSAICLRGGRLIDPARNVDERADLLVRDGCIETSGPGLPARADNDLRVIDVRDLWVVPGLIDLHTHLREPGQEYKEDIASGTAAAAAGGFSSVCAMPNTIPPNDCRAVTELMVRRAREVGAARVYPIGAITRGLQGEALAEMGELKEAGCVAVSDDGRPVMNGELMRRALEYARGLGLTVIQHCENLDLSAGGSMNEGEVSARNGVKAQPAAAESTMLARDLELVRLTGARYHVAHISAAESVRLVREAKRRGLPVTCEVTPHHLTLTEQACAEYDTFTKCNPPLRTAADIEALCEGLADGTVDAVATDHAPHSPVEKDVEFENAAFGMLGLETALPLCLDLVRRQLLSPLALIALLTSRPARLLGLPGGTLALGAPADITVIHPEVTWTCDPTGFRSKSKNSPFRGRALRGRAVLTLVGGRIVHLDEKHFMEKRETLVG